MSATITASIRVFRAENPALTADALESALQAAAATLDVDANIRVEVVQSQDGAKVTTQRDTKVWAIGPDLTVEDADELGEDNG